MNVLKAGSSVQGNGRCLSPARGKCEGGRRRSVLLTSVAAVALLSGATTAESADINNTAPFVNNGPYSGDVISNSSSIDNNAPGYWTGNIRSNTDSIYNNPGATWDGGILSNRSSQLVNFGIWLNGNITSNGNPADPLPAVIGSNGTIYNGVGGTWNGNVNGNSDLIINDGGTWNGNVNSNANYVLNNGGTWTGNVVGNSGAGSEVLNGGNALWVGDVVGNNSFVRNDGVWRGSVLSNSRTLQNTGTWTGNVAGNSRNLYNDSGIWVGDVLANGGTIFNLTDNGVVATWNGNVQGNSGSIQNQAGSRWNGDVAGNAGTITNSATWVGNVTGNAGTITNSATWIGTVANAGTFNNAAGATVSGLLTNSGTTNNAGTLSGGLTNNAGIINNTGAIGGITTLNGGTLTGNGTIANLATGNGGTFAPGDGTAASSMTVTGSLTLASAVQYVVQVNPATASFANVTGTATLGGGAVTASFANGSYISRQYTILNAAGGVAGAFGALTNSNLPANFTSGLSYDATHVYLNLMLNFTPPVTPPGQPAPVYVPLNTNQRAVGDALVSYFDRTGGIPRVFGALNAPELTRVSGETATGSQQTTFDAMTQFMGLMTDPFATGRSDTEQGGTGYTDEAMSYVAKRKPGDALAAIYRKAPPKTPAFEPRWTVWAAGFGGSQTTGGNATAGSNTSTSRLYGTAVGADYWFSPQTIAGFALAGGATQFSVASAGSGRSDLFQAGAFVRYTVASAYLTAAAAYGWQDITTDRNVGGSGSQGRVNANSYSGRIEGGDRFVAGWIGVGLTPYAAAQVTAFDLPAYAESVTSGVNTFALSYAGKTVTATRSELGVRSDKSFAVNDAMLTLRGRAAWAHDYNVDRSVSATFQTLPGASFVVKGATPARDATLTTASAELAFSSGISLAATFEGEFSDVTRSYAGKGVVRYAW